VLLCLSRALLSLSLSLGKPSRKILLMF